MATATATAPKARAQSMSCGVSPITTTSAGANALAREGVGPPGRQRRQAPPIHVVGAVGPDPEVRPEARGQELDAGALLDIAGHQAQHHLGGPGQALHHRGDARAA